MKFGPTLKLELGVAALCSTEPPAAPIGTSEALLGATAIVRTGCETAKPCGVLVIGRGLSCAVPGELHSKSTPRTLQANEKVNRMATGGFFAGSWLLVRVQAWCLAFICHLLSIFLLVVVASRLRRFSARL